MKARIILTFVVAFAIACVLVLATRAAEDAAKVAGKWEITWQGNQGPVKATLNLEQSGEQLKGTFINAQGAEGSVSGTVKGKGIDFTVTLETPNARVRIHYTGSVEGDTMKGTVPYGQQTREWTAKRANSK